MAVKKRTYKPNESDQFQHSLSNNVPSNRIPKSE